MSEIFQRIIEELEKYNSNDNSIEMIVLDRAIQIIEQISKEYNNGWIFCKDQMPLQPQVNPIFENKPIELYLVSVKGADYPIWAFWNGTYFSDGWSKVNAYAWQPLMKNPTLEGE